MHEDEEDCHGDEEEAVLVLYTAVFHYVFPILITMGILTNSLNLIVLTRPFMLGRTYRWLRALACVDLCLCVLTVPVCLGKGGIEPLHSYFIAHYYAHLGWSLSIASQILSFYLMGMFAFERFLAVCHHGLYPRTQTERVFRYGVAGAAVFVVLLYVPTMAVGRVRHISDTLSLPLDGYTDQEPLWYRAYAWIREIFSRLVPALLLTYCNVRITLRLRQLRGVREGFGSGVPASRRERERRLVVLLFWVTILFYIFNTPVIIYYLGFLHVHRVCRRGSLPGNLLTFAAISNLLQMMGNVSNFVLYFLISPDYQKTLCSLLSCRYARHAAELRSGPVHTSDMPPATTTAAATTITLAGTGQDESPTQSDSGCQHDLGDGDTPLQGRCNFLMDELNEERPGGRA
ncbi:putative G-protein coupled receptor [Chionoecetes opilio]|uniref:Putative G-protein coupled receptor n=1 Tax=Chionoecetes opilio TaxID=41210 RepID=A0A8J4Y0J4_CHIOP|nr:putative G-protein coupled receptor [Chionoecetes opilio]